MANPPPPYANITGISRTVMKDNAQETLVNYNGNARPGEIVADLTTDPPALYIGNNAGQLTAILGGGGGLPLLNGDSGFDVPVASGNVEIIVNDSDFWIFDTNGTLTTPGDITVAGDITGRAAANTLVLKAQPITDTYIQLNSIVDSTVRTFANLEIVTDSSNTAQTFVFGTDGVLTVPVTDVANLVMATIVGVGARAFVTDADTVTFANTAVGGGANAVPVYSDGSVWRIG